MRDARSRCRAKSTQNGGASPLEGGCAWVACLASASETASHAAGGRGSGLRIDALIERLLECRFGGGRIGRSCERLTYVG
jgi:hypothetical protein